MYNVGNKKFPDFETKVLNDISNQTNFYFSKLNQQLDIFLSALLPRRCLKVKKRVYDNKLMLKMYALNRIEKLIIHCDEIRGIFILVKL